MFNFSNILEEDERWFLRWLTLRRKTKTLELENGKLKSEVQHLEHLLTIYRKDEEFRVIKKLKQEKREEVKIKRAFRKKEIKKKKKDLIKYKLNK